MPKPPQTVDLKSFHHENVRNEFFEEKGWFLERSFIIGRRLREQNHEFRYDRSHSPERAAMKVFPGLQHAGGELASAVPPIGTSSFSTLLTGLDFLTLSQMLVSLLRKKTRKIARAQPMH